MFTQMDIQATQSQSWGFMSSSTDSVILGQVPSIATMDCSSRLLHIIQSSIHSQIDQQSRDRIFPSTKGGYIFGGVYLSLCLQNNCKCYK